MRIENKGPYRKQTITEEQLKQIQKFAEDIQYGTVTLVFQDGVLIQIERSEKIRLPRKGQ